MAFELLAQHAPDALVAFGAAGARTAAQLTADASRIAAALGPAGDDAGFVLLVFRGDRYAFMASLLGALSAGHRVMLPSDTGRETVLALAQREDTGPVLHDTLSGAPVRVDRLLAQPSDARPSAIDPQPLNALVRVMVREPSGTHTPIDRPLGDWLAEAERTADALALSPGMRVVSSVSPGHPYGLATSVLAPLLRGAVSLRERACDATQIRAVLGDGQQGVWATFPAELRALDTGGGAAIPGLRRIVSATAALDTGLSERLQRSLGIPIRDLSSEYPSAVEEWVSASGQSLCRTALEASLCAHDAVHDAAVWAPSAGPDGGRLLVALAAPTLSLEEGAQWVRDTLPTKAARTLTLDGIPRDALGALRHDALLRRFGLRPDGSPLVLEPRWGTPGARTDATYQEQVTSVQIPDDYAYFDGHFPGYPILPGAAQLGQLVLPCLRRARPELGTLRTMTRLKFLGRITPGDTVDVRLRWQPSEPSVDFSLEREGQLCAGGRLSFGEEATP